MRITVPSAAFATALVESLASEGHMASWLNSLTDGQLVVVTDAPYVVCASLVSVLGSELV